MHSSCQGELYNYSNLNDTNFYSSLYRERVSLCGFVKVGVRVRVIDMMSLLSDLLR